MNLSPKSKIFDKFFDEARSVRTHSTSCAHAHFAQGERLIYALRFLAFSRQRHVEAQNSLSSYLSEDGFGFFQDRERS